MIFLMGCLWLPFNNLWAIPSERSEALPFTKEIYAHPSFFHSDPKTAETQLDVENIRVEEEYGTAIYRSFEVSLLVENMCGVGDFGKIRFDVSKLEPPRNLSARVRRAGEPYEASRSISQGNNTVSDYLTYKGSVNFPPGNYVVEVSRNQGGAIEFQFTVGVPNEALSATVSQEWDVCPVNHATVHPVGGYGGYTYLWNDSNRSTTQTVSGLRPGNYTVIVTDSNRCTYTVSDIIIPDSDAIYLDREISHPACGRADGAVRITESNIGFGRHELTWRKDHPESGEIIPGDKNGAQNLLPGTYYLIVKEIVNGNCEEFPFEFILEEMGTPVDVEADHPLICEGEVAEFIPAADGAEGPVSFLWYHDAFKQFPIHDNSHQSINENTITYTVSDQGLMEVSGLPTSETPYQYFVEATGENVCEAMPGELKAVQVTVNPKPLPPTVNVAGGYLRSN